MIRDALAWTTGRLSLVVFGFWTLARNCATCQDATASGRPYTCASAVGATQTYLSKVTARLERINIPLTVVVQPLLSVTATVDALHKADGMWTTGLIGEFGRVLQHQDRTFGSIIALSCRGEMAVEDFALLNIWVGEKPMGGHCVGPVLAGERKSKLS